MDSPREISVLGTGSRWWKHCASYEGYWLATRRLLGVLWEFVRDSTPARLRQRYGDADYDWEYRVNTTSGAVGCVVDCSSSRLKSGSTSALIAASTTGNTTGWHPAITAFTSAAVVTGNDTTSSTSAVQLSCDERSSAAITRALAVSSGAERWLNI